MGLRKGGSISIEINDKTDLVLTDIEEVPGHDDCLPFVGKLYYSPKKEESNMLLIGEVHNDGWGGDCDINFTRDWEGVKKEEVLSSLKEKYIRWHGEKVTFSIYQICDIAATYALIGKKSLKYSDIETRWNEISH